MWNQGFLVVKLKSQVRTFNDCHHDFVNRYGISCHMTTYIVNRYGISCHMTTYIVNRYGISCHMTTYIVNRYGISCHMTTYSVNRYGISCHMTTDIVNRYGISCHIWPQICSVCLNHNSVLSSFMTYHQVCNKKKLIGTTSGARLSYSDHMHSPPILHTLVLLNL